MGNVGEKLVFEAELLVAALFGSQLEPLPLDGVVDRTRERRRADMTFEQIVLRALLQSQASEALIRGASENDQRHARQSSASLPDDVEAGRIVKRQDNQSDVAGKCGQLGHGIRTQGCMKKPELLIAGTQELLEEQLIGRIVGEGKNAERPDAGAERGWSAPNGGLGSHGNNGLHGHSQLRCKESARVRL